MCVSLTVRAVLGFWGYGVGGVGCNDIVELARMFDATQYMGLGWGWGVGWGVMTSLNLHACLMLRNTRWLVMTSLNLRACLMLRNTWWLVMTSLNLHACLMLRNTWWLVMTSLNLHACLMLRNTWWLVMTSLNLHAWHVYYCCSPMKIESFKIRKKQKQKVLKSQMLTMFILYCKLHMNVMTTENVMLHLHGKNQSKWLFSKNPRVFTILHNFSKNWTRMQTLLEWFITKWWFLQYICCVRRNA